MPHWRITSCPTSSNLHSLCTWKYKYISGKCWKNEHNGERFWLGTQSRCWPWWVDLSNLRQCKCNVIHPTLFLGFCFLTNPTKMPLMKWASLLGSLPTIIAARGLLSYIQVASSLDSAGLGSVQENHCHHGWISMIPFSLTTLQRDLNGRMKQICVSQIQLCPIWSLFGHTIMFWGWTAWRWLHTWFLHRKGCYKGPPQCS